MRAGARRSPPRCPRRSSSARGWPSCAGPARSRVRKATGSAMRATTGSARKRSTARPSRRGGRSARGAATVPTVTRRLGRRRRSASPAWPRACARRPATPERREIRCHGGAWVAPGPEDDGRPTGLEAHAPGVHAQVPGDDRHLERAGVRPPAREQALAPAGARDGRRQRLVQIGLEVERDAVDGQRRPGRGGEEDPRRDGEADGQRPAADRVLAEQAADQPADPYAGDGPSAAAGMTR